MSEKVPIKNAQEVDTSWIAQRMEAKSLTQVEVSRQTGIDKSNISAWISGLRPMSKIVKAMFYFMLK